MGGGWPIGCKLQNLAISPVILLVSFNYVSAIIVICLSLQSSLYYRP